MYVAILPTKKFFYTRDIKQIEVVKVVYIYIYIRSKEEGKRTGWREKEGDREHRESKKVVNVCMHVNV